MNHKRDYNQMTQTDGEKSKIIDFDIITNSNNNTDSLKSINSNNNSNNSNNNSNNNIDNNNNNTINNNNINNNNNNNNIDYNIDNNNSNNNNQKLNPEIIKLREQKLKSKQEKQKQRSAKQKKLLDQQQPIELNDQQKQLTIPVPLDRSKLTQDEIQFLDTIKNEIEPVLGDDEQNYLILEDVYIIEIEPQSANKHIKSVSQILDPVNFTEEFNHLKKIKKKNDSNILQLFLCSVSRFKELQLILDSTVFNKDSGTLEFLLNDSGTSIDDNNNNNNNSGGNNSVNCIQDLTGIIKSLSNVQLELAKFLKKNSFKVLIEKVPKYPPLLYSLWEDWNYNIWPCVYRVHFFSTPLVPTLNEQELLDMKTHMISAIEQAKIAKTRGHKPIGAVLVDPETNKIVNQCYDLTNRISVDQTPDIEEELFLSPVISHCIMTAMNKLSIDQVKEIKEKMKESKERIKPKVNNNSNSNNSNSNNSNSNNSNSNNSNSNNSNSNNSIVNSINDNDDNSINDDSDDEKEENILNFVNKGQYLANGYHLYITREPCVMCSMALVHSRIKRVVYGSSGSDGGLGTFLKIHTEKSLNHRFEVYKNFMKNECDQLYNSTDSA